MQWPKNILVVATCVLGMWLGYAALTMPRVVSIPFDTARVVGIWAPEAEGTWTNGDTHMRIPAYAHIPWRSVVWRWRQHAGPALRATISADGRLLATTDTAPTWRTMRVLVPAYAQELVIQSTTMRVAGDRRDLGPFMQAPTMRAMRVPWWQATLWVIDLWLPFVVTVWWLWRGGWWSVLAAGLLACVYGALVWSETRMGMQHATLWLDATGRHLSTLVIAVMAWRSRTRQLPDTPAQGRRLGLDVMRALAILCVVLAHFTPLLFSEWSGTPDIYRWTLYLGSVGVDIFFALSGYLIGGILLRVLPQLQYGAVLRRFWMRRWLRTLPAAYVSALVVWVIAPPRHIGDYLASIAFVGAINPWQLSTESSHWWSLGTEELFYVLFPLMLTLAVRIWPRVPVFLRTIICFAAVIVTLRLLLLWLLPIQVIGYTELISYVRLDSMVWGVLIQWWRRHHPDQFVALARVGMAPGVVIMGTGIALMLDQTRWYVIALFAGHMLMTAGAALLIPAFEYVHTLGHRAVDRVFVGIALVSYSAYLYHPMMIEALVRQFGAATSWSMMLTLFVVYLLATFVVATLSYVAVERPVLHWRDQHYPDHGAAHRGPTP